MPQPGTAQALWAGNADLARAALEHPFVVALADGSLPRADFAGYIEQDAYFLESFAQAYALAQARTTDPAAALVLAELIDAVRDELRLHSGYAAGWGIDMAQAAPLPATLAYTEFLLTTAATAGVDVICAAMTPCMRLYAYLGQSLAAHAAGPYVEWVATYAAPEFDRLAGTLESLLDAHLVDAAGASAAYRQAMRLEVAFFDSALGRGATL